MRLPPFDLEVLESSVGRHAGKLGRHAQARTALERGDLSAWAAGRDIRLIAGA